MLDIGKIMRALASRRPIFHSEADFQHEFAWEMHLHSQGEIRLERPFGDNPRFAIDVYISDKETQRAFELKYLCRQLEYSENGEIFLLKNQGSHDTRRYDVCKDIQRMEEFTLKTNQPSTVLVITNDPLFWNNRIEPSAYDTAFRISETSILQGKLEWATHANPNTIRNRESPLILRNQYRLQWRDYSHIEAPSGHFRYLQIDIPPASA